MPLATAQGVKTALLTAKDFAGCFPEFKYFHSEFKE
jgi:hypothetical protein